MSKETIYLGKWKANNENNFEIEFKDDFTGIAIDQDFNKMDFKWGICIDSIFIEDECLNGFIQEINFVNNKNEAKLNDLIKVS